ncbi:MAG: DUF222 domain-containing protein [Actinobacteria bacterium]|nr:DUF222 domain-containing protein [Actinomycetota bacterium]
MFAIVEGSEPRLNPVPEPVETGAETVVGALSDAEVRDGITELQAHINAAQARQLELVAEYERRGLYGNDSCRSTGHWLTWRCGLPPSLAAQQVAVATELPELPQVSRAFAAGELSFHQTRAIARVATPESEETLVEWARDCTVAQLQRITATYRRVSRPADQQEADEAHFQRYLHYFVDDDDSVVIKGRLDPENGAWVVKGLEASYQDLIQDAPEDQRREGFAAHAADALAAVCESYLANGPADDRHTLMIHVDAELLAGAQGGRCHTDEGAALPFATVERMACDCSTVPIVEHDGEPLDIGRKSRKIPTGMRRALEARDGGCCFPGCGQRRFVQGHHVEYWPHGGRTALSNLMSLCRFHHRKLHEGGYLLREKDDGSLEFVHPSGSAIGAGPPLRARGPDLKKRHEQRGLKITPQTCELTWDGSNVDLPLVIEAMTHMNLRC